MMQRKAKRRTLVTDALASIHALVRKGVLEGIEDKVRATQSSSGVVVRKCMNQRSARSEVESVHESAWPANAPKPRATAWRKNSRADLRAATNCLSVSFGLTSFRTFR